MIRFAKEHLLPVLVLLVAALALFGSALGHEFLLNWDDPGYVTKNEAIRAITPENIKTVFSRFYVGNYAPVQMLSYMLDYRLWGANPAGFIFTNILCHAASAILIYLLLVRFCLGRGASLAAALLFVVHPVQVETVVWISQRKTLLAMFFYLLAMNAYICSRESESGKHSALLYLLSLAAFAAALLAKSVAVILPITLVLYDLSRQEKPGCRSLLLNKLPYLLLAGAVGYLALLSQSADYGGGGRTGYPGGGMLSMLYTMLPVFATYARMIIWPSGLSVVYAPEIRTALDLQVLLAGVLLLLFCLGAVLAWQRSRSLFFWLAAIPVGLLPVAQIIPLVTLMNDRYLYFPMLGVAGCFAFLVKKVLDSGAGAARPLLFALLTVLLAGYSLAALQRSRVWQNSRTLWQDAVVKQPNSAVAWHLLAEVWEKGGRYEDAVSCEERARTSCRGVECRLVLRKLSELYLRQNRLNSAGESIADLLRRFPGAAEAYALQGHLFYLKGDLARAETAYATAVRLDPKLAAAQQALGTIYLVTRRPAEAMEKFRETLALSPVTAELSYSMACAAALLGNKQAALNFLDQALHLGYNNLESIRQNPELALLRSDPGFHRLLEKYSGGHQRN